MDTPDPHPTSIVYSNPDDGTSKHPNNVVLGNTEQLDDVQEIFTNYVDSRESYNRKTTIVDTYFMASIAENLQNDPDHKSMVECKKRSDWNK